ncbi:hypothetical protein AFM16_31570 [Streptomyces antibioticus]|uniref:Uncharacterized protein n=1 Tax=Streptomyces antibioticus TaxID=1890 RepID=A0ABX3LAE6_STRAT|nr:hypothetical protein AFM16_31570 [Streptomyces antibioticus]
MDLPRPGRPVTTLPACLPAVIAACMVAAGAFAVLVPVGAWIDWRERRRVGARKALSAPLAAEVPANAPAEVQPATGAPGGRLRLRSTPVPPTAPPATGPSRPRGCCQAASRGVGGGFPAPPPERPSQSHSEAFDQQETP